MQNETQKKNIRDALNPTGELSALKTSNPQAYDNLQASPTISLDTIQSPSKPLTLPPTPQTQPSSPNLQSIIDQTTKLYEGNSAQEGQLAQAQNNLVNTAGQGGRAELRSVLGEQAGLDPKRQALQSATNKLTQLQAEEDTLEERLQASVRGRGVTEAGLAPIRNAQMRDLAVRKRFAVADALVAQGDYNSAVEQVNLAVEDEFADRSDKINAQKLQIDFLRDAMERDEIRNSKAIETALKERDRIIAKEEKALEAEKAVRKEIAQLSLQARQYGADDSIIQRIQSAETLEEAIALAGNSLRDPMAILELENARLNNRLVNENITTEIGKRGTANTIQSTQQAQKQSVQKATDKIDTLTTILNHEGLNEIVGQNFITRGLSGTHGNVLSYYSGAGEDFIGYVDQIIEQEFLDQLINVKGEGATFGALTEREGEAIRKSANRIASWRRQDEDGNTKYYDIDDESFRNEINNIITRVNRIVDASADSMISDDEDIALENVFNNASQELPIEQLY